METKFTTHSSKMLFLTVALFSYSSALVEQGFQIVYLIFRVMKTPIDNLLTTEPCKHHKIGLEIIERMRMELMVLKTVF